jgi:hypothetical protein
VPTMKKNKIKFEKIGLSEYKTADGRFTIMPAGYKGYRVYERGKYMAYACTVNDAKQIIRDHVLLYDI